MIIIYKKRAYTVTRESAEKLFRCVLYLKLKQIYRDEYHHGILYDIIDDTKFPAILDSSRIFVYDESSECFTEYKLNQKSEKNRKSFYIKDFSPKYNGESTIEINDIFQNYSLKFLIGPNNNGIENAVINVYNKKCFLGDSDRNPYHVLTKAIKDIVESTSADEIGNRISNQIFAQDAFFICVEERNKTVCYALHSNGEIIRVPFSVNSIYNAIISELPKMKGISNKAKTAAIFSYNKILYGIGLTDYQLKFPTSYTKDGEPIFERCIKECTFWITPTQKKWRSKDVFQVPLAFISWKASDSSEDPDSTYRAIRYNYATYEDFSVVGLTHEEAYEYYMKTGTKRNILRSDDRALREKSWDSYASIFAVTHDYHEKISVFSVDYLRDGHIGLYKTYYESMEDIRKDFETMHVKFEISAQIAPKIKKKHHIAYQENEEAAKLAYKNAAIRIFDWILNNNMDILITDVYSTYVVSYPGKTEIEDDQYYSVIKTFDIEQIMEDLRPHTYIDFFEGGANHFKKIKKRIFECLESYICNQPGCHAKIKYLKHYPEELIALHITIHTNQIDKTLIN